jgi:hypothetical protein
MATRSGPELRLELARKSIGFSAKVDGFAMADGFFLIGVGSNKQLQVI